MIPHIARRIVQAIFVVLGETLIVFIILHLLPGGPARALLGPRATNQQVQEFIVANGYNKPVWIQYVTYLGHLIHGNLGFSYHYNQTVNSLLAQDLPKTAVLVGLSYLISIAVAIPLGILQAVRRNKPIDYGLTGLSFIGYSMPVFWLGILLILIFAVDLHWLPPEAPQGTTIGAILSQPSGLVLPVATLSIITIAQFSRFMRSSAIENLVQDYIRTARGNGLSSGSVLFRHLLRNSLLPIITLVGLSLPATLSGAVITESVFNYPGMGLLLWTAATVRDYPVMLGFTVVVGAATVVGSLLADILYAVADPRVRYA
jgi:peptide/nickel transport system permease protein